MKPCVEAFTGIYSGIPDLALVGQEGGYRSPQITNIGQICVFCPLGSTVPIKVKFDMVEYVMGTVSFAKFGPDR